MKKKNNNNAAALSYIIISIAPPKKLKRDEGQKGISRFFLNTVPNESTFILRQKNYTTNRSRKCDV